MRRDGQVRSTWISWRMPGSIAPYAKAKRFDAETLSVLYKGKNIYDILEMDVQEALAALRNYPLHQT